jgi:DNA-binding MarR family transcriptional regulator
LSRMASGGGLSELERGAWVGFLRAHRVLVAELDDELRREHDLPLTSFDVLVQLDFAPGHQLRMSELADAVLLSRSGLTRLVERLEARGLLERRECPEDARGAFAVLTDRGAARLQEARKTHLEGVRTRFLERFDEQELRRLGVLWGRVLADAHEDGA